MFNSIHSLKPTKCGKNVKGTKKDGIEKTNAGRQISHAKEPTQSFSFAQYHFLWLPYLYKGYVQYIKDDTWSAM